MTFSTLYSYILGFSVLHSHIPLGLSLPWSPGSILILSPWLSIDSRYDLSSLLVLPFPLTLPSFDFRFIEPNLEIWATDAQVNVIAINWRERAILLRECKWGVKTAGRSVIRELVEKAQRVVPGERWRVHYAFWLSGSSRGIPHIWGMV